MTTSTNFELNLVEGTDTVNPLVIDKPNYQKIDEVMYDNQNAGIQLATELKSGTVHEITRTVSSAPMFRFVATANYTLGDSFQVDSTPVTALTADGKPLESGAYVINQVVIGCLVGANLTLLVNSGNAINSEKLGGVDAEDYSLKTEVSAVSTVANAASTLATQNQGAINNINTQLNKLGQNNYSFFQNQPLYTGITASMANINVPAGKGIIVANLVYASHPNGVRHLGISTINNQFDSANGVQMTMPALSGPDTRVQVVLPYDNANQTKYYLIGLHNAGGTTTLNLTGSIAYLRLA